jgi:hypothetical protein
MVKQYDARGWKAICTMMGMQDKRAARNRLKKMGLLAYDGRNPVVSIDLYRMKSMQRHSQAEEPPPSEEEEGSEEETVAT